MNTISFMSANYVARQLGFQMTAWSEGDAATNAYYAPIETFAERFGELLARVKSLGFTAIDIWTGHLHWRWATDAHLGLARDLLAQHGLSVPSYAGGFGATKEEFEAACRVVRTLGIPVMGGSCPLLLAGTINRSFVIGRLKRYNLKLGLENHPEKTPDEIFAKIGDGGEGTLGAAVDTGWFGTQGYDAAQAIKTLGSFVYHVHLKDVKAAGAHETCRFGEGVVPLERCVQTLRAIGYRGAISVEHEPEHFDPSEDVRASRELLARWLAA